MTITLPERPDQLVDWLNDPKQVTQLIKEGRFGDAMDAYAKAVMDAGNGDLEKQLKEQVQLGLAEWMDANRVTADKARADAIVDRRMTTQGPQSSAYRCLNSKRAPGWPANGIFEDSAEWLAAMIQASGKSNARDDPAITAKLDQVRRIQNTYGSEVPASGGFLIPEHLRAQILLIAIEEGVVRQRATVIPMDSLRVPVPTIDDRSHVSNVYGGVQWYWVEEAQALTDSSATFARVYLEARKLTAYAKVPNELLDDAPAFAGFFDATFPVALAFGEDVAFFTGDGSEQPLGFISCPASVSVAKETGQLTNTVVWENIVKMYARMLPNSLRRAVWVCAIDTFPQLATMALAVGTGGGPVWIGNFAGGSGGADAPPMSILGRPVIFTEKANALTNTGDINFVDLSYYLIGDRMQMQTAISDQYLFANDQTAFRAIQRLDGRPWPQSAITPHNNAANTLSPFVQIAAR